jgi:twitching motility protein PilT
MLNIPAIRNLIREKKEFQIHSVMMTHAKLGMMTMDQCLRDRYIDRLITLEVAMAHAGNVGNLQRLISAAAAEGGSMRPGGSRPGGDRGPTLEGSSIGV